MTKEDKELLLQDFCCRLPYGVKVQHQHPDYLDEIQTIEHISRQYGEIETKSVLGFVDDFKPYLRPMSSMTKDEEEELKQVALVDNEGVPGDIPAYIDWLNKKMFDYRGLIPMDLALEAPEGMYNI